MEYHRCYLNLTSIHIRIRIRCDIHNTVEWHLVNHYAQLVLHTTCTHPIASIVLQHHAAPALPIPTKTNQVHLLPFPATPIHHYGIAYVHLPHCPNPCTPHAGPSVLDVLLYGAQVVTHYWAI